MQKEKKSITFSIQLRKLFSDFYAKLPIRSLAKDNFIARANNGYFFARYQISHLKFLFYHLEDKNMK